MILRPDLAGVCMLAMAWVVARTGRSSCSSPHPSWPPASPRSSIRPSRRIPTSRATNGSWGRRTARGRRLTTSVSSWGRCSAAVRWQEAPLFAFVINAATPVVVAAVL
jgi:hypothetical protein